jgi:hypothetical protein
LAEQAQAQGVDMESFKASALPVVRELCERGFLLPVGSEALAQAGVVVCEIPEEEQRSAEF